MLGIFKVSALTLVLYAARRCMSAPLSAQPDSTGSSWTLGPSPYGPGAWLTGPSTGNAARAFVPPGTRAFHDESDAQRGTWRHLTVDADLSVAPTVTILDEHEVYRIVPACWRGWVLEQSIRHSDGAVRGADLLEGLSAMTPIGSEILVEGALRVLGRNERLSARHVGRAACSFATHVASSATQFAKDRADDGQEARRAADEELVPGAPPVRDYVSPTR